MYTSQKGSNEVQNSDFSVIYANFSYLYISNNKT